MSFLSPLAFLLAAILPIIIAMYLLKLRRVEQTVASTYLWRRMVRDVEANAPWQKLRRNLLLLIQLLDAALLMLALARPFTWADGPSGANVVLILDRSMSMAATDVLPNRLDFAKAEINRWIDSLPNNTSVTLIAAGASPDVVVASTRDRRLLKTALSEISVSTSASNLQAALTLATAIANQNPDVSIQLYSDFAGPSQTLSNISEDLTIDRVRIGTQDGNQAISAMTLEADEQNGTRRVRGFIQVANFSAEPAQRRVRISTVAANQAGADSMGGDAEEQLNNVVDVDIPARSTESIVIDELPADTALIHAQFVEPDLLVRDDDAWAVAQDQTSTEVLLVSAGNRFLETGLALLPGVSVTVQRPDAFEQGTQPTESINDNSPRYALTIFDSFVPMTATLPASNLFFIGPTRSTDLFDVTGVIEQPRLVKTSESDPRLNNLVLGEVNVLSAARMMQPDWATPLLVDEESQSPMLMAGTYAAPDQPEQRIAALSFDIRNSDLPLQVAFPLLLANMIDWLEGGTVSLPPLVEAGAVLSFLPPPAVDAVEIELPDETTVRPPSEAGRVNFGQTEQTGVYTVRWNDEIQGQFIVNGYSATESDILPGVASLTQPGTTQGGVGAIQQSPREWWRLVALLALITLMAEWLVYHRGTVWRYVSRFVSRPV